MKHFIFYLSVFLLMQSCIGTQITNIQPEKKPGLSQVCLKNITSQPVEIMVGEYRHNIAPGKKFKKWFPSYYPVEIKNYGVLNREMEPRFKYDFTPSLKLLVMAKTIEQEVKDAIGKLRKLPKEFYKKERRKILRTAAKPLIKAAKGNIPQSKKPHHRYNTAKLSNKIRAPKGKGKIIATYYPGNLRKSIRAMTFRRSSDVFVGPRVSKRGKGSGQFGKGNRVDGYYANQMEFGNRNMAGIGYMRKAVATSKARVQVNIIKQVRKKLRSFEQKHRIR